MPFDTQKQITSHTPTMGELEEALEKVSLETLHQRLGIETPLYAVDGNVLRRVQPQDAIEEAIKKAYRGAARGYHPDLVFGSAATEEEKRIFGGYAKGINEAEDLLKDPVKLALALHLSFFEDESLFDTKPKDPVTDMGRALAQSIAPLLEGNATAGTFATLLSNLRTAGSVPSKELFHIPGMKNRLDSFTLSLFQNGGMLSREDVSYLRQCLSPDWVNQIRVTILSDLVSNRTQPIAERVAGVVSSMGPLYAAPNAKAYQQAKFRQKQVEEIQRQRYADAVDARIAEISTIASDDIRGALLEDTLKVARSLDVSRVIQDRIEGACNTIFDSNEPVAQKALKIRFAIRTFGMKTTASLADTKSHQVNPFAFTTPFAEELFKFAGRSEYADVEAIMTAFREEGVRAGGLIGIWEAKLSSRHDEKYFSYEEADRWLGLGIKLFGAFIERPKATDSVLACHASFLRAVVDGRGDFERLPFIEEFYSIKPEQHDLVLKEIVIAGIRSGKDPLLERGWNALEYAYDINHIAYSREILNANKDRDLSEVPLTKYLMAIRSQKASASRLAYIASQKRDGHPSDDRSDGES